MPCQQIEAELAAVRAERTATQAELRGAEPGAKPRLAGEIRRLGAEAARLQRELDACRAAQPPAPTPMPLTLSGTARMTSDYAGGSDFGSAPVSWDLLLNASRTNWQITRFAPVVLGPFTTRGITNTTTVTLRAGTTARGPYDRGAARLALALTVDHSFFLAGDSTLDITIATDPPGSPVAADGAVVLAGTGILADGLLGGSSLTLTVFGVLAPIPPRS